MRKIAVFHKVGNPAIREVYEDRSTVNGVGASRRNDTLARETATRVIPICSPKARGSRNRQNDILYFHGSAAGLNTRGAAHVPVAPYARTSPV